MIIAVDKAQKERKAQMRIDRENRVKVLQNLGQYLIDHADELVPEDISRRACKQTFIVEMGVEVEIPRVKVNTEYIASETLVGVDWSAR